MLNEEGEIKLIKGAKLLVQDMRF